METIASKKLLVAIPFCNTSNRLHLNNAIKSILNQSLLADRIILIQDGCVESSLLELVDMYVKQSDRIKVLTISERSGLPHALNSSIDLDYEYYARMDADDISHEQRFKKQIDFLEANKNIDILGTWAIEFQNDNHENGFLKKMPSTQQEISHMFHFRDPFIHPSVIFRTIVFKKIGYYNEKFLTNQDTELWARALKNNIGAHNLQEALLYFRADNVATKRSDIKRVITEIKARYSYNTFLPHLNVLKAFSVIFRFMPGSVRKFLYSRIR